MPSAVGFCGRRGGKEGGEGGGGEFAWVEFLVVVGGGV